MAKCYIVVLNYKQWQDTVECLQSVFTSTYVNFTLIVIDNDSQNQSIEHIIGRLSAYRIKKHDSEGLVFKHLTSISELQNTDVASYDLVLIQNDFNLGFAGGNNVVLRRLLSENAYVWLLNPDMVVKESTLGELISAAEKQPQAIIGSVTKSFSEPDKVLFYGGGSVNFRTATVSLAKNVEQINNLDYISGGCLFTHTSHFQEIGLLPEDYFLYWEETDWCYEARRKGYEMVVCITAICYDKISTTIGKSFLADYYYTRNGLLFVSKYKKDKVSMALVFAFVRLAKRIVRGEWKRARGVYKGMQTFLKQNRYENK